jgi:hypothetical protein
VVVDKAAIYRKTEKGLAEITATQRTVDRRLRPLLILVDGHRTAMRIHSLIGGIGIREEDFDQLVAGGFIETVARPEWSTTSANEEFDVAAPAARATAPAPAARRSALERFVDGQRYLSETAAEKLGLTSYFFILKIEKCSSAEELMRLLPDFERAIAAKLDKDYAHHCRRIAETVLQD